MIAARDSVVFDNSFWVKLNDAIDLFNSTLCFIDISYTRVRLCFVTFFNVFYRRLEWKNFEVVNNEPKHINVRDVLSDAKENLGKYVNPNPNC